MKKHLSSILSVSILALALAVPSILFARGTAVDTTFTAGDDQGTLGTADAAGDSVLMFANPLFVSNFVTCNNVTTATVSAGYDLSVLQSLSDESWFAGGTRSFLYTVTNRGNLSDVISISVAEIASSGGFTGAIYSIRTNGVTVSGPLANPSWNTPLLAADAFISMEIIVSIPSAVLDGGQNSFGLSAKNQSGSGANDQWPGADAIAPATPDLTGVRDSQSDQAGITVVGPNLALDRTFTVVGGSSARPRPFDTVEYASVYSNRGSGTANNVYLVDYLPANTLYVTNSAESLNTLHAGSVTVEYFRTVEMDWTDSTYDAAGTAANISKIRWTLSDAVASGAKGTIKYRVLVE